MPSSRVRMGFVLAAAIAAGACGGTPVEPQHADSLQTEPRTTNADANRTPADVTSWRCDRWRPVAERINPASQVAVALADDGRVVVSGGFDADGEPTAQAEIYDPTADRWFALPAMHHARIGHTMTALPRGRVLVLGGWGQRTRAVGTRPGARVPYPILPGEPVLDGEMLNLESRRWSPTAPLPAGRKGHTATLLTDGRVLVVGGTAARVDGFNDLLGVPRVVSQKLRDVSLYDPSTNSWEQSPPLEHALDGHRAVRLRDGSVLLLGPTSNHTVALRFEPDEGRFHPVTYPDMVDSYQRSATLLADGRVLLLGGDPQSRVAGKPGAIFDPVTESWAEIPEAPDVNGPMGDQASVLLPDASVLVTGGGTRPHSPTRRVLRFEPRSMRWSPQPKLPGPMYQHAALLLSDASVLLVGGQLRTAYRCGSLHRE